MPKALKRKKRGQRRYSAVIKAIYETPWAIREEKLQAIREFLARKSAGDVLSRDEIQAAMSGRPQPVAAESRQVALINVMGTICPRLTLMDEISGGCSCEAVGQALDAAVADGNVGAIVLNFDTPGGNVFGVEELGDKIYAARSQKQIIGIANHEAASAGYWLLSQCSQVVVAPNGWVGSIGVLMIHTSSAGWEEKQGYQTTITRTPATKAEGAAGEALTPEAQAYRQAMVDQIYGHFVAAVARGRKVSAAEIKGGFGQGRMVMGEDAKQAGMVDRVATLEQVLSELGVTAAPSPDNTSEPAFPFEGFSNMDKKIFGALVRIGMCPITATKDEAIEALDRFFAVQGVASDGRSTGETPSGEAEQLAALEAYIKEGAKKPQPAAAAVATTLLGAKGLSLAVGRLDAEEDLSEEIMAAVKLSSIPEAEKFDFATTLISERIKAADGEERPLTMKEAFHKIQAKSAERAKAGSAGATVIQAGEAERDKFELAARDAILQRTMKGSLPKQIFDYRTQAYQDWKPQSGGPRTLLALAQQCLMFGGLPTNQVLNMAPVTVAKLIMGARPEHLGLGKLGGMLASDGPAYNVSGMFSNILFDASNVSLRRSFDDGRTTYQQWTKQGEDIPDFKDVHRIIAGEVGDPKAIPEDGQFEETTLTDGKEKYKLTVWGEIFSHSWQLIVNDSRLGAFMEIPNKMGNAMKRKSNRLVYQVLKDNANLLNDNVALFDTNAVPTGHNNITTGVLTTTADYTAAWNTVSKKMREQRGLNTTEGSAMNIGPRWVLFPPALRGIILTTLGSTSIAQSGNMGETNIWLNGLEPVEDAELGASSTGGSDVKTYYAADAAEIDTIEWAVLEGLGAPVIEMEPAFDRLAMRRRIYWAFGVKALEYRGLQRHNGA